MHALPHRCGLAAAALAAMAAAMAIVPAAAQSPQKLRVQASFPPTSVAMDGFKLYSDRVRSMSAGQLDMEGLAAGTVVPAFEILDAVNKNAVDAGYSASAYWVGKLFGATPGGPYGMDELDFYGWLHTGGGLCIGHRTTS